MATQYSPILKLALPVAGELSGTWGDVVNENITSMLEEAIAGRKVINTWTANSHTLTVAEGLTSESRSAILEFTDTGTALTGAGTVVCPDASKIYLCKNDTGQQVTIKTSSGTGVIIPDGTSMIVFCDGTNVFEAQTNTGDYAPTNNATFTGDTTAENYVDTVYTLTGTALDPANGNVQTKTMSANTTFTDSLTTGESLVLVLSGGDTYTATYPTMTWAGGVAPTLTSNDALVFWKVGSTLYGAYIGSVA